MTTAPDFEPDDLRRGLEAFSVVTVALEDDGAGLGRHVTLLLAEIDARTPNEDDRGYERAMLLAALGSIAALALKQWAVDQPTHANEWLQVQAAHYEAVFPKEAN